MFFNMTFVTLHSQLSFFEFSSSIIPTVPVPMSSLAVRTDHQAGAQNSTDLTQELPPSTASPRNEIQPQSVPLAFGSTSTSVANPDSMLRPANFDSTEMPSPTDSGPALNSVAGTSGDPVEQLGNSVLQPTEVGDLDIIMADDTNLPTYLTGMIGYLCTVAVDQAWQDLVMNFVAFEKIGLANGISAM